jgi:phospholipase C
MLTARDSLFDDLHHRAGDVVGKVNVGRAPRLTSPSARCLLPEAPAGQGGARSPDGIALCPALAANPTGPFPDSCASFDQLGFRVPFVAVSPFSKPHYVSHTVGDHTSLLALIERRFLMTGADAAGRPHLTKRDQHADALEDLFDFDNAPSFGTPVTLAAPPATDCTP